MAIFEDLGVSKFAISSNFVAFASAAVSGLLAQLMIANSFGAVTLGLFNQTLALYLIISQFGVLGMHAYAQRESALALDLEAEIVGQRQGRVNLASIAPTALLSSAIAMILFFAAPSIAAVFDSQEFVTFIHFVIPGIWLLALNKVLLAICLGRKRFSLFAFGQAGRPILFFLFAAICVKAGLPHEYLSAALSAAEFTVTIILLVNMTRFLGVKNLFAASPPIREALGFGARAFPATFAAVANSKADILILGIFIGDAEIGIYAAAVLFIDALIQIPVVLRAFINPSLAINYNRERLAIVASLIKRIGKVSVSLVAISGALVFALFPWLAEVAMGHSQFGDAQVPFGIIAVGLTFAGRWLPADQLLNQTGHPQVFSYQKLTIMALNIIFITTLVPTLGTSGAAIGYSLSFLCYGIIFKYLVKKTIGLPL